jgi:hypothetical protein
MMFVSNIWAVFLMKLNLLRVLFPCHDTKERYDTGIVPIIHTRHRHPNTCTEWTHPHVTNATCTQTERQTGRNTHVPGAYEVIAPLQELQHVLAGLECYTWPMQSLLQLHLSEQQAE